MEKDNIYVSLDEARNELKKRWADVGLRKRVEEELGENFMPQFKSRPRGVSFRQLCSPDNGFTFFYQCAKYVGTQPLILEYHGDIFVSFNEEKKGLGRLRLTLADSSRITADIMNFHNNEKRKLDECILKTGEKLVDFHKNLFKISKYQIAFLENTKYLNKIGHAIDYYYYIYLHFICHGVLFETYSVEEREGEEIGFTNNIILPTIKKVEAKLGLNPLIIRAYPENQSDEEDFYWWSYQPNINDYLIEYAKKNRLTFKKVLI